MATTLPPGSQTSCQPRSRGDPVRTFAGLAHLIEPAEIIADLGELTAAIDAIAASCAPEQARARVVGLIGTELAEAREKVRAALLEHPQAGLRIARSYAHIGDVVVAALYHFCVHHLHPAPVRTKGEQLVVIGVGGTGRGEMAPHSDLDLLFLTPWKRTPWGESVIESMLYLLWDLKLRVGQAVRSVEDCLRLATGDMTIRTTLLEMRPICGDAAPFADLEARLWKLFRRTRLEFVEAKLAETDARHERHGGSRYLLEPNVKEGKGGLRDLQSLHWISKYIYHIENAWDLVEMGVFEHAEVRRFAKASKFLWAVRCHLHDLAGRAQEQLTFDRQVEIARRMGFADHDGRMAVEHFMHAYFRHAKNVGDLTRIFSAGLEAQQAKRAPRLSTLFRNLGLPGRAGETGPFVVRDGRLSVRGAQVFAEDPVNLLRLFREAARLEARIHPAALRLVTQSLDLIDEGVRHDPAAARLFLEMLTDKANAEWLLRRMNETGILGRYMPEFGRVVAMMQFNMYHHYTVDEHTIQAIGVMNRIERLEEDEAHPVSSEIVRAGNLNPRVLYMALFLHDLGKGEPRDHSEVGAEIAEAVCPRLGLDEAETEAAAWLVRHHLLMSDVAQKRDTADPGTVRDFARIVQSPGRLRHLLVLTVCDIRAVGPGVWNNWKAQLLRKLYWDTRDLLTGGGGELSRAARVEEAQGALAARLADWPEAERAAELERHYAPYWLGLDTETQVIFAELARESRASERFASRFVPDESHDATKACLYMSDHPGIFARMAGAFALAGANTVDARTYTTPDGMACSTFWIQDREGHPFEESRLPRLKRTIERILKGEVVAREALDERRREKRRERSFTVPTRIHFENDASELFTVIEVNARDRLGLLHVLARTLTELNINIFSAVIATYGEHAVDVFYVKDLFGHKIRDARKLRKIERRLIEAIEQIEPAGT